MSSKKQSHTRLVAGLILGGTGKEDSFLTVAKYFEDQQRWAILACHSLKDDDGKTSDELIIHWIRHYGLKSIVVDFPLSSPLCSDCPLQCPGEALCPRVEVIEVRKIIKKLLKEDNQLKVSNPKKYEKARHIADGQSDLSSLEKTSDEHLLSRSFKRRLKKGFLPYWNRPLDLWIWCNYFNPMQNLFKITFSSFGQTSSMLVMRLKYLLRHFPANLNLSQSQVILILLELMRAGWVEKKHIKNLSDIDQAPLARVDIIKSICQKSDIFYYEKDFDLLIRNPKAFDSFLLCLGCIQANEQSTYQLPSWTLADESDFVIAKF